MCYIYILVCPSIFLLPPLLVVSLPSFARLQQYPRILPKIDIQDSNSLIYLNVPLFQAKEIEHEIENMYMMYVMFLGLV